MATDWDQKLKTWAETINADDEKRGSAAAEEIRKAIHASPLSSRNIEVRVSGSYCNNTNVRRDSDIDVAVVLRDVVFYVLPADGSLTREMLGFRDSDYSFAIWRDDVSTALRGHFGKAEVSDGDKAFNVRSTGSRLEADVAVFMEHRRYTGSKTSTGAWEFHEGVEMRSRRDPSRRIVNWPQQHHDRGMEKNKATNRRFKRMVRIFKHLAADMAMQGTDAQKSAAGQVSSFFLECLVYNAPNACFNLEDGGYLKDTRAVLTWLGRATHPSANASDFVEVSEMERLFRATTGRTQEQAYAFLQGAWSRIFEREQTPW